MGEILTGSESPGLSRTTGTETSLMYCFIIYTFGRIALHKKPSFSFRMLSESAWEDVFLLG